VLAVTAPAARPRSTWARDAGLFGLLGALLGGPWVGAVVLGLVALGVASTRGRVLLRAVPAVAFAGTLLWYVAKQWRNRYPMGVEWPDSFAATHGVVLVAMVVLVAETVLRRRDDRGVAAPDGADAQSSAASDRA
jgi:hypothetical protein